MEEEVLTKVAEALLRLSEQHIFDECEANPDMGDGGYAVFMMEDCDEEYDNVRQILIGKSTYSKYRQQEILKAFMKTHKITKEEIQNHFDEKVDMYK